ncbi:MAG: aminopeptidase P family protein [Bacteroidales bacterium]|nr:aminopeptidase P family protein [Bacteroidales bacterium]
MTQINERISALRQAMKQADLSAYIIPGTDPHASEYIADYWKEREWISGFDGSAGTVALTLEKAGLWTDSRYFLQGAEQLKDTEIELMKQGEPETLEIVPWLTSKLKKGDKVGVNAEMFSVNAYADMKTQLALSGIELVSIDLLKDIWSVRPELPKNPFFVFDVKYAGKSVSEKLVELREEMQKLHADVFVMSALDDIAWLFNIRGNDVDYNPVVIAYALVDEKTATLFIALEKITEATQKYLDENKIHVKNYSSIHSELGKISKSKSVLVDGSKFNQSLYESIPAECTKRTAMSPVFKLKAVKNKVEMNGVRKAMMKDGIALTRFFMWLEKNVGKEKLTEISISDKLRSFREAQPGFKGESFGTIAGYGAHGAIVHYKATPASDVEIKKEGILLLDSGGQYLDGTTDITRTVALGKVSKQAKRDYTLVLKGHIQLGTAKFPVNTRGSQLDVLARKSLWDKGLSYGHGTGHGIGHFLNVHEGPQNIRMDENPITLVPGMIISNEPGLYRTGEYGIRIENLVHVIPAEKTEFGQFYQFETLTLCYIDTNLVDKDILSKKERKWLNNYHKWVYKTLSPYLSEKERKWLGKKTEEI